MRDFKQLLVWQKAHEITLEVYRLTKFFPRSEIYGLTLQLRRASLSIGSNLAEGCGRDGTDIELRRYVQIASGSTLEAQYQLLLAHDLKYLESIEFTVLNAKIDELKKMLNSLMKKLKANR